MKRRSAALGLGSLLLAPAGVRTVFGQQPQQRRGRGPGGIPDRAAMRARMEERRTGGAQVGEPAPDFKLTPLKFYDFKTAETEITQENAAALYEPVSLSHFKDKKPVALIFGSYT